MTEKETLKILAVLAALYPADMAINGNTSEEISSKKRLITSTWMKQFENYSYEEVSGAIHAHIGNDIYGKAPTIGKIKSMIQKVTEPYITPIEAWNILYYAICHGGYDMRKVHEKLPYEIKICVTPEQMYEWGFETDAKTCQTVIASNFQRSFQAKQQYLKQMDNIPSAAKISLKNKNLQKLNNSKKEEITMLSGLLEVLDKAK